MNNKVILFKALAVAVLLQYCTATEQNHFTKIEPDSTFNQLFTRSGGGFTGGDGTYSVLLPDGRTVWIFGDTFLGTVKEDSTRDKMEPIYIRNSFVVQNGEELVTITSGTKKKRTTLISPPEGISLNIPEDSVWYWPGDGLIEDGSLKLFVSKFHQFGEGMWDFAWLGGAVATFSLPDLTQTDLDTIPSFKLNGIHFGHAIIEDDVHTYIYGLRKGKAYGARAKKGEITGSWQYYSSGNWIDEAEKATPVLDVTASEQFSVLYHKNSFYLISQLGELSPEVWAFKSDKPYGWQKENGKRIYSINLPFNNPNLFVYNALVHPQFIDEQGRILLSYNTNSHRLQDHFDNAHIYKPRFVRIPLKILE